MRQRRDGGRTADAGPAAVLVPALTAVLLAGCSAGSQPPVSIGPGPGGVDGCVLEAGTEVCATGAPSGSPSSTPSGSASAPSPSTPAPAASPSGSASLSAASSWGGGRRVGSFRTTGTASGVQAGGGESRRLTGTCDVARDVRTVTTKASPTATLVISVTGRNVASVTLRVRGGTTWLVEYVGASADDVVTLTPTRTRVSGARLVRVSGPAAEPISLDADFDC